MDCAETGMRPNSRFLLWKFHVLILAGLMSTVIKGQESDLEIIAPGVFKKTTNQMYYLAPAMELATAELQADLSGLLNVSLTFLQDDFTENCTSLSYNIDAMLGSYFYRRKRQSSFTVVIIAGCLESLAVARLTLGWNTLLVIGGFADPLFVKHKDDFPNTLITSPVDGSVIFNLLRLMYQRFSWTNVHTVIDMGYLPSAELLPYEETMENVFAAQMNMKFRISKLNSSQSYPEFEEQINDLLAKISRNARVVTLYAHTTTIRKFMIAAAKRNMTNGNFAYRLITTQDLPNESFGNYSWKYGDGEDEISIRQEMCHLVLLRTSVYEQAKSENVQQLLPSSFVSYKGPRKHKTAREAFRSALLISSPLSSGANITKWRIPLARAIGQEIQQAQDNLDAINSRHSVDRGTALVSSVARSMFMGVAMLGTVFKEKLSRQNQSSSCVEIQCRTDVLAARLWNRTVSTSVGEFLFDGRGVRRVIWDVNAIDPRTGLWTPALRLLGGSTKLEEVGKIDWVDGSPVKNEPLCGFTGERCRKSVPSDRASAAAWIVLPVMGIAITGYAVWTNKERANIGQACLETYLLDTSNFKFQFREAQYHLSCYRVDMSKYI